MRIAEVANLVPVAMRELHDEGHPWIYINELGRQVTSHDKEYLKKRARWRKLLARIGIHIDEYPSGWLYPRHMHTVLDFLEESGTVESQFIDASPGEEGPPRRGYRLVV
jgi:hypothetical protein